MLFVPHDVGARDASRLGRVESPDVIVLGAGPSGLGAGLALARSGAGVLVLEAGAEVGGLCRTRKRDGHAYDVGGHIPFVEDESRRAWLDDLMDGDLHWVDRPVSCVRDSRIVRGRYLDQRGPAGDGGREGPSAADLLGSRFGADFVTRTMRPYLEKVDGVALEDIPAERAQKLLETQAAPEGFWFPGGGIGALMNAMAGGIRDAGGQVLTSTPATAIHRSGRVVTAVEVDGPGGPRRIACPDLVVASPAGRAHRLLEPAGAPLPPVRMRAVAIVCLEIATEAVSDEAWIQVDDPEVAFARAFEPRNWSRRMAPEGRTMLGLECYCSPAGHDPVWELDDPSLAERCAEDLIRLGWIAPTTGRRLIEVIRLPAAYPEFARDQLPAIGAPRAALEALEGTHLAPGAAVIEAIAAGEDAAAGITERRSAA